MDAIPNIVLLTAEKPTSQVWTGFNAFSLHIIHNNRYSILMGSRYRKVKRRERSHLLRGMEQVSKLYRIIFSNSVISSGIIQLQRQEDGNWKEVSPCPKGRD